MSGVVEDRHTVRPRSVRRRRGEKVPSWLSIVGFATPIRLACWTCGTTLCAAARGRPAHQHSPRTPYFRQALFRSRRSAPGRRRGPSRRLCARRLRPQCHRSHSRPQPGHCLLHRRAAHAPPPGHRFGVAPPRRGLPAATRHPDLLRRPHPLRGPVLPRSLRRQFPSRRPGQRCHRRAVFATARLSTAGHL